MKLIQFSHCHTLPVMFKIMPILPKNLYKWIFSHFTWQVNCLKNLVRDSVTSISSTLSEQFSGLSVTALIVDDEKDICYLLTRILHLKNIKTLQANSLSEAEQIIEKELPPVIFLDNYLPDGLGINTIKKIKIKAPKSKIVMISAHDNASERAKAQAEGADYFIEKPFTKDLIFSVLAKLCSFIS